jgi:ubiquitin C-terminal hydrolase
MSRSLLPFNPEYLPNPFGLINFGGSCYYNAMMQAIMTCTSFNEVLLSHKGEAKYQDEFISAMINYTEKAIGSFDNEIPQSQAPDDVRRQEAIRRNQQYLSMMQTMAKPLWDIIIRDRVKHSKGVVSFSGQQDAFEMLRYFFDQIEEHKDIQAIFKLNFTSHIHCHRCNELIHSKSEKCFFTEVPPDLKNERLSVFDNWIQDEKKDPTLTEFLLRNSTQTDTDYRCTTCIEEGRIEKIHRLRYDELCSISDILIITTRIYLDRRMTKWDNEIIIPISDTENKKYIPIAQIIHHGSLDKKTFASGGHYTAKCLRRSQNGGYSWWLFNDTSFTEIGKIFEPDSNTYIVIYHYISDC